VTAQEAGYAGDEHSLYSHVSCVIAPVDGR